MKTVKNTSVRRTKSNSLARGMARWHFCQGHAKESLAGTCFGMPKFMPWHVAWHAYVYTYIPVPDLCGHVVFVRRQATPYETTQTCPPAQESRDGMEGRKIKKSTSTKMQLLKQMPRLKHKPDDQFSVYGSEVIQWIVKQPDLMLYLFDKCKQSGCITYDSSTGEWHGVDVP